MGNKREAIVGTLLLTFVGGGFRLISATNHRIWLDEGLSLMFAFQPFIQVIQSVIDLDVHPPTYYLVLNIWSQLFGQSELALRGLSILFGTLTIPVFYLVAREFFDDHNGLIATTIFTFSACAINYAIEIRMYSLLLLFSVVSYYTFIKFTKSSSRLWLFAYFLSALILIYVHIMGLTLVAAQNLDYFVRVYQGKSREEFQAWVVTQLGLGLAFLPWLFVVIGQASELASKTQRPPPGIFELIALQHFFSGQTISSTTVYGILTIVGIIGWFVESPQIGLHNTSNFRNRLASDLTDNAGTLPRALIWYTIPILLQFGFAYIIPRTFDYRHIIMALPALLLLFSYGVITVKNYSTEIDRGKFIYSFMILAIILLLLPSLANVYSAPNDPEWQKATTYVEENANNNAIIVVSNTHRYHAFTYYINDKSQYEMYALGKSTFHPLRPNTAIWPGTESVGSGQEIWEIQTGQNQQLIRELESTHSVSKTNFTDIQVRRYEPREQPE